MLKMKKRWYHLLLSDAISFFLRRKCQRTDERRCKHWQRKSSYLLNDSRNSNQIFTKDVTSAPSAFRVKKPLLQLWFWACSFKEAHFLLQLQGAENWGFLISTESKLFYNTETNMHLSTIFTEWKKSYFVEQPFLADYLFWQKIISCISSFCGDF